MHKTKNSFVLQMSCCVEVNFKQKRPTTKLFQDILKQCCFNALYHMQYIVPANDAKWRGCYGKKGKRSNDKKHPTQSTRYGNIN